MVSLSAMIISEERILTLSHCGAVVELTQLYSHRECADLCNLVFYKPLSPNK